MRPAGLHGDADLTACGRWEAGEAQEAFSLEGTASGACLLDLSYSVSASSGIDTPRCRRFCLEVYLRGPHDRKP